MKLIGNIFCEEEEDIMKHDEAEQANTASQEIEVARRNIAKSINNALDDGIGDRPLDRLLMLATALEKIR